MASPSSPTDASVSTPRQGTTVRRSGRRVKPTTKPSANLWAAATSSSGLAQAGSPAGSGSKRTPPKHCSLCDVIVYRIERHKRSLKHRVALNALIARGGSEEDVTITATKPESELPSPSTSASSESGASGADSADSSSVPSTSSSPSMHLSAPRASEPCYGAAAAGGGGTGFWFSDEPARDTDAHNSKRARRTTAGPFAPAGRATATTPRPTHIPTSEPATFGVAPWGLLDVFDHGFDDTLGPVCGGGGGGTADELEPYSVGAAGSAVQRKRKADCITADAPAPGGRSWECEPVLGVPESPRSLASSGASSNQSESVSSGAASQSGESTSAKERTSVAASRFLVRLFLFLDPTSEDFEPMCGTHVGVRPFLSVSTRDGSGFRGPAGRVHRSILVSPSPFDTRVEYVDDVDVPAYLRENRSLVNFSCVVSGLLHVPNGAAFQQSLAALIVRNGKPLAVPSLTHLRACMRVTQALYLPVPPQQVAAMVETELYRARDARDKAAARDNSWLSLLQSMPPAQPRDSGSESAAIDDLLFDLAPLAAFDDL